MCTLCTIIQYFIVRRTAFCGYKHGTGALFDILASCEKISAVIPSFIEAKTKWNIKMYMVLIEQVKYARKMKKITCKISAPFPHYWPFFHTISARFVKHFCTLSLFYQMLCVYHSSQIPHALCSYFKIGLAHKSYWGAVSI